MKQNDFSFCFRHFSLFLSTFSHAFRFFFCFFLLKFSSNIINQLWVFTPNGKVNVNFDKRNWNRQNGWLPSGWFVLDNIRQTYAGVQSVYNTLSSVNEKSKYTHNYWLSNYFHNINMAEIPKETLRKEIHGLYNFINNISIGFIENAHFKWN